MINRLKSLSLRGNLIMAIPPRLSRRPLTRQVQRVLPGWLQNLLLQEQRSRFVQANLPRLCQCGAENSLLTLSCFSESNSHCLLLWFASLTLSSDILRNGLFARSLFEWHSSTSKGRSQEKPALRRKTLTSSLCIISHLSS